ncbi:hypothetical protein BLM14_20590 (plasmid) [Phyllobacterium zundukense]|nr:hypothetical protein BLM14_20590 [Phyllobacterium zundukense]
MRHQRHNSLPDPALAAVSVTTLVPHHSHCETFDGKWAVYYHELVGTVAYETFWNKGNEVRVRHDLRNEQE